jgi:hypothetical protein
MSIVAGFGKAALRMVLNNVRDFWTGFSALSFDGGYDSLTSTRITWDYILLEFEW